MSKVGFFGLLKQIFANKQLAPLPATKAEELYHHILQASRAVPLYRDYGVEDSIDGRFDALPVSPDSGLWLTPPLEPPGALLQSARIGIKQGLDLPWRWLLAGSPSLSKPVVPLSCSADQGATDP